MNMLIELRAWDNVAGEMIYSNKELYDDMLGFRFDHFESDELIFMLYTNLKDAGGAKIYEGDILQDGNTIGYVKFDEGKFVYIHDEIICEDLSEYHMDVDIVGNIHRDEERLEVL